MKLFFLILFSLFSFHGHAASCCVANTSVPNLMLMPSTWQQTFSLSQNRVIGDVDQKGSSTFRSPQNKDTTSAARMDLSYRWSSAYQSGVSLKYQNRSRQFNGSDANDSGWGDVGLFHAYEPKSLPKTWFFQNVNIPTATSVYNSQAAFAVDAQGSGTYQTGLGIFHVESFKTWDLTWGSEVHRSFARTFHDNGTSTEVKSFSGGSISLGGGYIPWHSQFRYGVNLTPRYEGQKIVKTNGQTQRSSDSLVWDSMVNITYTLSDQYAFGASYVDQTLVGPAKNNLLSRSVSVIFQTRWL